MQRRLTTANTAKGDFLSCRLWLNRGSKAANHNGHDERQRHSCRLIGSLAGWTEENTGNPSFSLCPLCSLWLNQSFTTPDPDGKFKLFAVPAVVGQKR
ncbi:MAG: hypothetical protein QM739_09580 [Propionivibrio sp.]